MKKSLAIYAVGLMLLTKLEITHGATEILPDSEGYARALLFFKETKEYQGSIYGQKTNGVWTWGSFVMNKDRRITKLTVDDVPIPIDPLRPLAGLPFPIGVTLSKYSVNLDAIDIDGRIKAHGMYSTPTLTASSVIRIGLMPYLVPKFVAYSPPAGVVAKLLRLVLEDGSTFWYDPATGGFMVWLDPFGGAQDYEIVDGPSGVALYVGVVGPIIPAHPAEEKALNISYAGNVEEISIPYVSLTDEWILPLRNQRFDSWVAGVSSNTPAKVYITDLKRQGGLIVRVYDTNALVSVKGWIENGDLPKLFCAPFEQGDNYLSFATRPELGKIIVTITSPHTDEFFGVDFIMFPNDVDPTHVHAENY